MQWKVPDRLTPIISRQSASSVAASRALFAAPALLTRIDTRCPAFAIAANVASTEAASATSQGCASHTLPSGSDWTAS